MSQVDLLLPILVVDDDAMVRDIVIEYLNSFGFQNVIEAKSSVEALRIIQKPQQNIGLVLSDWDMPTPSGLDLLKCFKASTIRKGAKFIMITSQKSAERIKIAQAASFGVDAYIVKPFRAHTLKDKIWSVMEWNKGESDPKAG